MIAVGGGGNALRAGLMGTEQAGGGAMPMIWAGSAAASSDGIGSAAFRVYNSGHVDMGDVSITSTGSAGAVKVGDGAIMMNKKGGAVTQLTADTMGSLTAAIGKAGGGSTTATASSTYNESGLTGGSATTLTSNFSITETRSGSRTVPLFTATFNGKLIITESYSKSGSVTTTAFAGEAEGETTGSPGGISPIEPPKELETQTISAQSLAAAQSNSVTVKTAIINVSDFSNVSISLQKVMEDGVTISKGSDGTYTIKKGKKYTAQYSTSATHVASFEAKFPSKYSLVRTTKITLASYRWKSTQMASVSIKCTQTSTEYVNKYYADGFMLFQNTGSTDSTRRYAGMSSADATVMQMGSGAAILKFTDKGLMQSLNGGGVFQHLGPMLFHVVYSNNTYVASFAGKNYTVNRNGAGKFQLQHNLGTTNYMAFAQAVHSSTQSSNWWSFARVAAKASATLDVWLIDRDGSFRDDDCEIAIFRW